MDKTTITSSATLENESTQQIEKKPTLPSPAFERHIERGQIVRCACAIGMIGCFFAPWEGRRNASPFSFALLMPIGPWLLLIPIFCVLTLASFKKNAVQQTLGTITALFTLLFVGYLRVGSPPDAYWRWGASLTMVLAFVLYAFSGDRRLVLPIDLVAKKVGSRKGEIYSHSLTIPADVHFSAQDFYANIQTVVRTKQWPGVQVFRIDYSEAGMLSHKREYLRIVRHRHFFDLCASTFGKDYFFSVREAEIPAEVTPHAIIGLLLIVSIVTTIFVHSLGYFFGGIAVLVVGMFAAVALFNVLRLGRAKMDSMLLQTPIIGPIYEAWFRPDTYFQQDSRMVFLHAVSEMTKHAIEQAVSAKGIKFLDFFEKHPILGELYKRSHAPIEPVARPEK